MGSLLVPALTAEARAHLGLLCQADGAVGPGAKRGESHLEATVHAVHTHGSAPRPPPHGGRGGPMEGTAALQRLLQGTRGIEQPAGGCGGGRVRNRQGSLIPSALPPGPSLLLTPDSQGALERLSGSPEESGLTDQLPFILSPHLTCT